ncbi:MAG TPA: phage major capsid protein [Terriglobales bacterium]|nr:phage major capsid protein [Terriglobales bacterium]
MNLPTVPGISVPDVQHRMADLRQKRTTCLRGRAIELLSEPERDILTNIDAQLGFCGEQLREHQAGARAVTPGRIPGRSQGVTILDFDGEQHRGNLIPGSVKEAVARASAEEREQFDDMLAYMTGRSRMMATANLSPAGDGGLVIPSFLIPTLERNYAAFTPVVNNCRLYGTETGAPTTIPVVSDSESAEQLDPVALTGADATVSGDTPPTALTGPQLKAYKISSKPIFVSRELAVDSPVDFVQEVLGVLFARIMRFENLRYTTGTGSGQAEGFLTAATHFEGSGTLDLDEALDLAYSVPPLYRPAGIYMASDSTIKYMRKLKTGITGDKRNLWKDAFEEGNATLGTPAKLHGYSIIVNNDMPSVAADGSYTGGELAFGSFQKFVVRQAELAQPFVYSYLVPAKDGRGLIVFRRSDSKLLVGEAISKLVLMGS